MTSEVTVRAKAPGGAAVASTDSLTLSGPTQTPAITMTKTATAGGGFAAVGDTLTYDYVVTNAGNVTLTEAISIADDRVSVTCPALPLGGLAPGGTLTCSASDTLLSG